MSLLAYGLLLAKPDGLGAASVPAGFTETVVAGPWSDAVGTAFENNGRIYVWERTGKVWFKDPDDAAYTLLLDISEEVGAWEDHGMLGFALDPNFRVNGNIYLLYVVDRYYLLNFGQPGYDPNSNQYNAATIGRVTRYTCTAANGFRSVDPASRVILIGETKQTGFPMVSYTHGVGSLVFGEDGTLLVSCGDGATADSTDQGGTVSGSYAAQALSDGIIRAKENIGALRSQLVDCLNGKVVRIDPATGDGLLSNPYYDPANPRAPHSRVWALGLRNPFRMALKPESGSHNPADGNPGVLYVGDVGWNTWECLRVVTGPRQNFGWPLYEGLSVTGGYDGNVANQDAPNPLYPVAGCNQYFTFADLLKEDTLAAAGQPPFNNPCDSSQKIPGSIPQFLHVRPVLDWNHASAITRTPTYDGSGQAQTANVGAGGSPVSGTQFKGNCAVGGTWYTGTNFPAAYQNRYYFADWGQGVIKTLTFDANDKPVALADFASSAGAVVSVVQHPVDGSLYYISYDFAASTIQQLVYTGNRTPLAVASADKYYGPTPLAVQLSSSGSIDPDGQSITYSWDFGDGSPLSTQANPGHTFSAPAGVPTKYVVTLTVTDSGGLSAQKTLIVSVNNTPPNVAISSPVNGALYSSSNATPVILTAVVSDAESSDNQLLYQWQVLLHHNDHNHGNLVDTNHVSSAVISPTGCDGINIYYYRVLLTVTDPAGLATTREVRLYPDCGPNTPPGISGIANQTILQNGSTGPINFTVGDAETAAVNLQLSGGSSNPTLIPTNDIVFGGSGSNRTVTVNPAGGQTGTATITVTVNDGPHDTSTNFFLTVNPSVTTTKSFTNTAAITIPNQGAGTPYPSTINVTGLDGAVTNVTVTLRSLSHTWKADLDVLLVSPGGQKVIVMSDAGSAYTASGIVTITLSDSAAAYLPASSALSSGTFKPTDYAPADTYPAPAPAGPYGTTLSTFTGQSPNGSWSLYVFDDGPGDQGSFAEGWSLTLTTLSSGGSAAPTISDIPDQTTTVNTATSALPFTIADSDTPVSNLTLSAGSSNPALVPTNNIVFGGSGSNRTVTVTPATGQTGAATITVTVSDGTNSASDVFVLTVNAVNTPPMITGIADQTINEDTATTALNFTVGDAETAAGSLTLSKASSDTALVPLNNIVFGGSASNRTITVTPAANQNGTATITLTVSDGQLSASTNFAVTVNAVNDPPTITGIANQAINVNGTAGPLSFTIGDVETPPASLTPSAGSSNPTLVPTNNIVFGGSGSNRTVTVTPAPGQSGTATIIVSVSDGELSVSTNFVLTVSSLFTGTRAFTNATAITIPSQGVGSPYPSTITVSGMGGTITNMSVMLRGLSHTWGDDINVLLVGPGGQKMTVMSDAGTGATANGANLTFSNGAAATLPQTGSLVSGTYKPTDYSPADTYSAPAPAGPYATNFTTFNGTTPNGTWSLYVFDDGAGDQGSFAGGWSLMITTVSPTGAAPTISDIADQVTTVNTPTPAIPFTIADADTAVSSLTLSGGSSNPALVPTNNIVFGGSGSNRTVTVSPVAGQAGTAIITVTVSDGGSTASDTFVLTVNAVNTPPTITGIPDQTINEDTATGPLGFTVGDAETAVTSLTLSKASSNPALVPTNNIVFGGSGSNRTVTVSPATDQNGAATITVTVSDGTNSASTNFLVTVNAVNDPPTITGIANQAINEDTSTGPLSFTVGDVETPAASLTLSRGSSNPALVPTNNIIFGGSGANRTVTVTPTADQIGTTTITVGVSDGALSSSANFVVTVNVVNNPPTITGIADQTINEDTSTGPLSFTVGDVETPAASLTLSAGSSNPVLVPTNNIVFGGSESNRTVTVSPAANQNGTATVTISVNDGTNSVGTNFVVTVNAVNDPPTITGIADQTINEDTSTGPLSFTVGDVETAAASLTLSKGSSNPALVPTNNIVFGGSGANRTVTVTPVADQSGAATITLTVDDGVLSVSTNFVVTVSAVNDPPTITGIADQTTEVNLPTAALSLTIGDVETSAASLSLSAGSSNPALVPTNNIVFGGSGNNRTVTVTPATNQAGTTTITVSVSDGQSTASTSFILTVSTSFTGTKAFTNGTAITIPSVGSATPYPSTINVSGMGGVASNVTVMLNNISHQRMRDIDILLIGPGGQGVIVLSDVGPNGVVNNVTLTLSDAAASSLGTGTIVSGTYKPTNITTGDTFASPAPAGPYGTTMSAFNGTAANGTWSLYVVDDTSGSTGSIAGGWSLTVTTANAAPTITGIADQSINVDGTTGPLNFTVGDLDTPLPSLVVSSGSSNPTVVPTNNIVFGGSGSNRTVTVTPAAGQTGTATITVSVSDGQASANTSFVVTVATLFVGTQSFTNGAVITIPDSGAATPYPSTITVVGMGGTINNVAVTLRNLSHTWGNDIDVLLVGPGGQKVTLMSDAGTGGINNANLTFADGAAGTLPQTGSLVSGTYKPTDYAPADTYPAPAPPGPYGTNLTVFNGTIPNGTWSLYVFDDGAGDQGSFASGWSVTITTAGAGEGLLSAGMGFVPIENPPKISSIIFDRGAVQLTVTGEAGFSYALEASSDLLNWIKLSAQDNMTGMVMFNDQPTTNVIRFYRAVVTPK